jgi:pyridoxal phosphate enzyme (YggS family)
VSGTARAEELASALHEVRQRIERAARAVGREPESVTLVVVTKTWPASDVRILAGLGVTDVAENRDQEARAKAAAVADLDLRWHFVGQLQRNKTRSVASYATVVESVDRRGLAVALGRAAHDTRRELEVLVQIDLADPPEPHRGGAVPSDVLALCDVVTSTPGLALCGVMAVAPLGEAPREAFGRLAEVAAEVRAAHPEATVVSAGMSHDLEDAVAAGATHVRVGTAVLGGRPALG